MVSIRRARSRTTTLIITDVKMHAEIPWKHQNLENLKIWSGSDHRKRGKT